MSKYSAAIGLYNPKDKLNIGSAMRAVGCFGASMLIASCDGRKTLNVGCTDTGKFHRHIPFLVCHDLFDVAPQGHTPVAVEYIKDSKKLQEFKHPKKAFYIFGPENGSLPEEVLEKCESVVHIPTEYCLNLAATVNVVLYDRLSKQGPSSYEVVQAYTERNEYLEGQNSELKAELKRIAT